MGKKQNKAKSEFKKCLEPVRNLFNPYFALVFAYFLVKLFEIYPDIPLNFTKKALKICQNLRLKKIPDRFLKSLSL
jgi:hypothetical protein